MKQKIIIHKRSGKTELVNVQIVPAVVNAETGETAVCAPPPARYLLHQLCRECADEWFLRIGMTDGH